MQAATSTVRKAFSRSVRCTGWPGSKPSSRSPSSATVPALAAAASAVGDHALPARDRHRAHHARRDRRVQRQQRVASVVRELHREAARLAPADRLQQAADRRQADRLRVGKGEVGGVQRLRLPHARAPMLRSCVMTASTIATSRRPGPPSASGMWTSISLFGASASAAAMRPLA